MSGSSAKLILGKDDRNRLSWRQRAQRRLELVAVGGCMIRLCRLRPTFEEGSCWRDIADKCQDCQEYSRLLVFEICLYHYFHQRVKHRGIWLAELVEDGLAVQQPPGGGEHCQWRESAPGSWTSWLGCVKVTLHVTEFWLPFLHSAIRRGDPIG